MSGSKEGIPELEKQEDVQARRTSHLDLCQEICDLNRQVRMMSDSLAACKQMSKRRHMNGRLPAEVSSRPHQTTVEVAINTSVTYKCVSRTTDQIPVKEEKLQIDTNKKSDKSTIISYMVPNNVPNFEKTQGIVKQISRSLHT
ncbi:hypothetical protein RUM43_007922 [Polyplax serrata]|uniref:Uncharacterized protein n=1 Tax=Polyplax serrata TaxID=468196 RepID=A0AAN8S8U9_POLSC